MLNTSDISQNSASTDETAVTNLYRRLLNAWNRHSASEFAGLFTRDANVIGFDGSQMNGRIEIAPELSRIFAGHETAEYVAIVKEVRLLPGDIAILRAATGMVPPGGSDINPAVNAVQTLVARKETAGWIIELFQNTPAQFHERPDLAEQMTEELRSQYRQQNA